MGMMNNWFIGFRLSAILTMENIHSFKIHN